MCQISGDFVTSPKKVGDRLEAGAYFKNDDGTPVTSKVYLKGYNVEKKTWLTFAETVPNQTGWGGMPMITLTDAHAGTWTMSWDVPGICGGGPYQLIVSKTATPILLSSDKISIQQGDTVMFSGKYKPGASVNIYEDFILPAHIAKATCDAYGDFKVLVNLNLPVSDQPHKIRACEPSALTECHLFGDTSGVVYIYVQPRQTCTPSWHCIEPRNGMESDGCGHQRRNSICNPTSPPPPPPGACQPPYGQRYCVDSQTIAVWNQVKCQYDIAKCSTGECKDGYCATPPPPPGAECTEAAGRRTPCPGDPTKEKLETCYQGKWTVLEDPCEGISTETLIVIAVVIVVLVIIVRGRK